MLLPLAQLGRAELLRDGQPLKSITVGDTVGNRGLLVDEPKDYTKDYTVAAARSRRGHSCCGATGCVR